MFQTTSNFLLEYKKKSQKGGVYSPSYPFYDSNTTTKTKVKKLLQPSLSATQNLHIIQELLNQKGGKENKRKLVLPTKKTGWIVYGREGCPCCMDAITFLQKYKIPFKYYTIDELMRNKVVKNKEHLLKKLGERRLEGHQTFPIIFLNDEKIGGWVDLAVWVKQYPDIWKKIITKK